MIWGSIVTLKKEQEPRQEGVKHLEQDNQDDRADVQPSPQRRDYPADGVQQRRHPPVYPLPDWVVGAHEIREHGLHDDQQDNEADYEMDDLCDDEHFLTRIDLVRLCLGPGTQDGSADSNHGSTFLNCNGKITAHTHGELIPMRLWDLLGEELLQAT